MSEIVENIRDRINNRNKNFLAIVCGETGSGKSFTAQRLAELIDPSFDVSRIVFTPEEFMRVLNSGKLKSGNAIVFDEAGVGLPAREWYSISNKAINYIFQTFRHENLAVILTTPSFDFIDSQTRKLFHAYIETIAISRSKQQTITKFMNVQFNAKTGKLYFKYPRIMRDGRRVTVTKVAFGKPSYKLIEAYEKKKKQFTKKLKKEVEQDIKAIGIKKQKKDIDIKKIAKSVQKNIEYFRREYHGRWFIDKALIKAKYGIGERRANMVKRLVEVNTRTAP